MYTNKKTKSLNNQETSNEWSDFMLFIINYFHNKFAETMCNGWKSVAFFRLLLHSILYSYDYECSLRNIEIIYKQIQSILYLNYIISFSWKTNYY